MAHKADSPRDAFVLPLEYFGLPFSVTAEEWDPFPPSKPLKQKPSVGSGMTGDPIGMKQYLDMYPSGARASDEYDI